MARTVTRVLCLTFSRFPKILRSTVLNRWHEKGAIEEFVALLTGSLRIEKAAVAGCAEQWGVVVSSRLMVRTDRVVGA